jgi:isochorismate synthase
MEILLDKAKNQFAQNLPFVLYCKPNSASVIGVFQQNDILYSIADFTEKGFVFVSFDGKENYFIPENQSEITTVFWDKKEVVVAENGTDFSFDILEKAAFENLVEKGIQAIENEEFKKVVLSRKESVELIDFDLLATFEKLVQLYPTTFVYCFFHPKTGIWLGATPEQLIQSVDNKINTIALAGTIKNTGSEIVKWGNKEIIEQQFVTDYIVKKLENVVDDILVSEPYNVKAGSIWHIKTDISGLLNSNSNLQQTVALLHPTPAICGFPKEASKAFIIANEKYERTFYTGFLGELNHSQKTDSMHSDLFVNLRCMQIEWNATKAKAHLYVGCGITKDSIPEKEWEESVYKAMSMKRVLNYRK